MDAELRIKRTAAGVKILGQMQKALKNPFRLLYRIGVVLLQEAEAAFAQQHLGELAWPHRYPNQADPFVNIAGAVMDLERGPNIKARRFDRRPALSDTGALLRSLAPYNGNMSVGPSYVEVGSTLPYAGLHQSGGESELDVTPAVKANLAKFIKKEKKATLKISVDRPAKPGKQRTGWDLYGPGIYRVKSHYKGTRADGDRRKFGESVELVRTSKQQANRQSAIQEKLTFLFREDVLSTKVSARPFLGITDKTELKILKLISRDYFAGGA